MSNDGYDVWLPNLRGAGNSNRHVKFPTDSEDFWNFRCKNLFCFFFSCFLKKKKVTSALIVIDVKVVIYEPIDIAF